MTGYLGHLVQRSLTDFAAVTPRPISIFEPSPSLPAVEDAPASFAMERIIPTLASDSCDLILTAPLQPSKGGNERTGLEVGPPSDAGLRHRGDVDWAESPSASQPEPRHAPAAVHTDTPGPAPATPPTPPVAGRLVQEQAPPPSVAESRRPGTRLTEDLSGAPREKDEKTVAPQRRLREVPVIEEMTEAEPLELPLALRVHRRLVQAKLAAEGEAQTTEGHPQEASLMPTRGAGLAFAKTLARQSETQMTAPESGDRSLTPQRDSETTHGASPQAPCTFSSTDPFAPAQAVPAPCLPQRPAQPVQASVLKSSLRDSEMIAAHPEPPVALQERAEAVLSAQASRRESSGKAASESELRTTNTNVPSEAPRRIAGTDSYPAAQAVLVPRLPQQPIAQPAQASPSKHTEPIVHVTIGRVEIRAVPAPSAPKRSTPSKPTLSLSDYLNRRSGGRG